MQIHKIKFNKKIKFYPSLNELQKAVFEVLFSLWKDSNHLKNACIKLPELATLVNVSNDCIEEVIDQLSMVKCVIRDMYFVSIPGCCEEIKVAQTKEYLSHRIVYTEDEPYVFPANLMCFEYINKSLQLEKSEMNYDCNYKKVDCINDLLYERN